MKKLVVLLLCTVFVFTGCSAKEKNIEQKGVVSFTAIDGFSGLPIEDVKIVLPENNCELMTDSDGRTEKAEVKVIENQNYTVKQNYGTFTVLAYKEGYNDYALFYAQIKKGQERNIKLYMFLKDTPLSSGTPLATVESPDKEWVSEIVKKYKK